MYSDALITNMIVTQVRIAGTENTSQYWTSLGSQKSANISIQIGPLLSQYWHCTLEFQICQASAEVWPSNGTFLGRESVLLRQTMLEVEKPESGPAVARYSAGRNLPVYWQPVTRK